MCGKTILNKLLIKISDLTINKYNLRSYSCCKKATNDIEKYELNIIHEPDVTISKEINEDYRAWVNVTSIINAVL